MANPRRRMRQVPTPLPLPTVAGQSFVGMAPVYFDRDNFYLLREQRITAIL